MTEQTGIKQNNGHDKMLLVGLGESIETTAETDRAKFERRQEALASCHEVVKAMTQETNALVKRTLARVHEVTKHVSILIQSVQRHIIDLLDQESSTLFTMLPKANSQDFAIMAVTWLFA